MAYRTFSICVFVLAVLLLSLPASAQLNITNGANIDMSGSTGSVIIFPDATQQSTAQVAGPPGADGSPGADGADGTDAAVPAGHGGLANTVSGNYPFVGGGYVNTASGDYATVTGGRNNTASGYLSTVGGGEYNATSGYSTTIGGGLSNSASGYYATVAGGNVNSAAGDYSFVGGGRNNTASATYATIAGGGPSDPMNLTTTNNRVTDDFGTIGGGANNQAGDNAGTALDHRWATVGGGLSNTASGGYATVGGGYSNTASDANATVGGGYSNTASGFSSTVAGGVWNKAAGDYSFAAGRQAKINAAHHGAFLFADSIGSDFNSAALNEFAVRASGGVRFLTDSGATVGVSLAASGTSWAVISAKSTKENYEEIDAEAVLDKLAALPIQKWNYIANDDTTKHIGPYAEDFYEAFGLNGEFNGRITTQDIDGVALAAIQGLNAKLVAKERIIASQGTMIADMAVRLAAIEQRLSEQTPAP